MLKSCKKYLLVVLLAICPLLALAQGIKSDLRKTGSYKITLELGDNLFKKSDGSTENSFRLAKYLWGEKIIIDSASTDGRSVRFSGTKFPLYDNSGALYNCDSLFTAGEYAILQDTIELFKFFCSTSDATNFDCIFRQRKSDSPLIAEYECLNRRGLPYARENKNYLLLQDYYNTLALRLFDDEYALEKIASNHDFYKTPAILLNSELQEGGSPLLATLLQYSATNADIQMSVSEGRAQPFCDDRLYYTDFGERLARAYATSLDYIPVDSAARSIDNLLDNKYLTDQKRKEALAYTLFETLRESKNMNATTIAVYVADKYILNTNKNPDDARYFDALYYATINRNTLTGRYAPPLALKDTLGDIRPLSSLMGEYTIVYFYSDDCIFCKEETPALMQFLDGYTYTPINIYAVYTGTDKDAWRDYIKNNFSTLNPFVYRVDVADLERESDFAVTYGVTSTPTCFLLDARGAIIGRRVRSENIKTILEEEMKRHLSYYKYFSLVFPDTLSYGYGEEVVDQMFDYLTANIDTTAILSEGKNDPSIVGNASEKSLSFMNDLLREMYLYLSSSDNYENQCLAAYLGEKYICGAPHLWRDSVFKENVKEAVESFKKNMLGTRASDIELYDIAGNPANLLGGGGLFKVLLLYKPECDICKEYVTQLYKLYEEYKEIVSFTAVYTLEDAVAWRKYVLQNNLQWRNLREKTGGDLNQKYDTQNVPSIYLIDSNNIVIAKDITPGDLEMLLKKL